MSPERASNVLHPWRNQIAPLRGELGGNRTHDPRIKSALLYRLSYELLLYLVSKVPQWANAVERPNW